MKRKFKQSGFSLTEVLMAAGILAVGLMLVATMFPLGIHLSSVAAERTMAAIVADCAFAKIKLYGVDLSISGWSEPKHENLSYFEDVSLYPIDPNEFAYPSTDPNGASQFYFSAACRKLNNKPEDTSVQVTVFVGRKKGPGQKFGGYDMPIVMELPVENFSADGDFINIANSDDEHLVNPPTTIADGVTGRLYRVIARDGGELTLDRSLDGDTVDDTDKIIMLPPDSGGSRNADIGVFQRIIKF